MTPQRPDRDVARLTARERRYHHHAPAILAAQRLYRASRGGKMAHRARLLAGYGMTLTDYDRLLRLQDGVCAVCLKPPKPGMSLAVDHDHKTKKVRGLLHGYPCNYWLASVVEARLAAYCAYVADPPASHMKFQGTGAARR